MPFDFYLPEQNIAIEYDGVQHFEMSEFFGDKVVFNRTRRNDIQKTAYLKHHNIHLLRVAHDVSLDKISDIVSTFIQLHDTYPQMFIASDTTLYNYLQ